ncbi:hypothetical protein [Dechloromonas sp. HYN0024]|uniref:hypothetical protein n=1 Tax=Dechloromonas sp. HYN0024 TaxID=2231055 RepID=UPI000E439273|nr:hypothetical protein [Dechloromonas sp. HYN0024]AXS80492.1 hypothetical protein HYN24_10945 [Dechloromonas sp. HYN0024]
MNSVPSNKQLKDEPLAAYLGSVKLLGEKLGRIASGKKEIAGNLSRAAAALRSIAAISKPK